MLPRRRARSRPTTLENHTSCPEPGTPLPSRWSPSPLSASPRAGPAIRRRATQNRQIAVKQMGED
ncbi:hypothetical protein, partial [Streptomyces sp. NPDC088270]|uniref:hypothetical protein n=1 Tax=Streptomyces sp. NPDC088270 TaxID=3160990 RepID=UPI00343CDB6D